MPARVLVVWLALSGFANAGELLIERAVLSLIEHADVPAEEAGRLDKLLVHEGDIVQAGQGLAQIDDRDVKLALQRAQIELATARFLARDLSKINSAKKKAEKERQIEAEQQIDFSVAEREAMNDVAVRAAEKAKDVAANQHTRAVRSREASKNSVSETELDGLKLALERASLDHEQAGFQLSILKMKLDGKRAALKTQALAAEAADLEIREAESLQQLAGFQADLKKADIDAAELKVTRRMVKSPIEGVVVEMMRHTGEWVQPGDKVARVIRLSRLRAEGMLPLAKVEASLPGRSAIVEVPTNDRGVITREGRISFVSPDVDPINQQVRVWVEFDNTDGALLPGMRATVRVGGSSKPVVSER